MENSKKLAQTDIGVASFFAGIGGFDLGFENAGMKSIFQCEINDFCNKVLIRHWPSITRNKDICILEPTVIPDVPVWCGGFPCQDVSVARGWLGRDGLKGRNTGLFFDFAKLVAQRKPQVVIMENVTGLLNSHNGKDFAIVIQTLRTLGYGVSWRTLNTRYFGAPQSRPRVFVCGWKGSTDSAYHVLFEEGDSGKPEKPRLGFLRSSKCKITGAMVPEVAFCLAATSGRHTGTDWSRSYVAYENSVRRLTPTECERIQGFPENWTLPKSDLATPREDIDSLRYHAVGNAVSVPVVEWIGRRVVKELRDTSPAVVGGSLFDDIERFGERTPQLLRGRSSRVNLPQLYSLQDAPEIKWASAGLVENDVCIMGSVSHMPKEPIDSLFVDALDKERPNDKYFLTPNAASGILRRVNGQRRRLFEPLGQALEKLQLQA